MPSIAENIVLVCERIRYFEQQYGRPAKSVKLLAVSKKQDPGKLREAFAAGITDFGENYLQEAQVKMKQLSDLQLVWHFIGPIQANKTRGLAEHFHWIHSVDRLKIAHRLSEQRLPNESPLKIFPGKNPSPAQRLNRPLHFAMSSKHCHILNFVD